MISFSVNSNPVGGRFPLGINDWPHLATLRVAKTNICRDRSATLPDIFWPRNISLCTSATSTSALLHLASVTTEMSSSVLSGFASVTTEMSSSVISGFASVTTEMSSSVLSGFASDTTEMSSSVLSGFASDTAEKYISDSSNSALSKLTSVSTAEKLLPSSTERFILGAKETSTSESYLPLSTNNDYQDVSDFWAVDTSHQYASSTSAIPSQKENFAIGTEVLDYPSYYGFDSNYKAFLLGARQNSMTSSGIPDSGDTSKKCTRFTESNERKEEYSRPSNQNLSNNFFGNISFSADHVLFVFSATSTQLSETANYINNTLQMDPSSEAAKADTVTLLNTMISISNNNLSNMEVTGGGMLAGNLFDAEKLSIQRGIFQIESIAEYFTGYVHSKLPGSSVGISQVRSVESIYVLDYSALGNAVIAISLRGSVFELSGLNTTFQGAVFVESIQASWTGTYIIMSDCSPTTLEASGEFMYTSYVIVAAAVVSVGIIYGVISRVLPNRKHPKNKIRKISTPAAFMPRDKRSGQTKQAFSSGGNLLQF